MSSAKSGLRTVSAPRVAAIAALDGMNDNVAPAPRPLRVLVVEDDVGDAAQLDRALRLMPHYVPHVLHAHSVAAARHMLTTSAFDVLIVDYTIQDDVGTKIASEFGGQHGMCPVILMSGLLTADIENAAFASGAAACLDKSDLTPRVLENVIRQAVRGLLLHRTVRTLSATQGVIDTADQHRRIVEQIVSSAKSIAEELSSHPQLASSHWEAVKLQSLVQSFGARATREEASGNNGQNGQLSGLGYPLNCETAVDLQDILLDAGKSLRRNTPGIPADRLPLRFSLSETPLTILGAPHELVQAFAVIFAKVCNTAALETGVVVSTHANRSAVAVRISRVRPAKKSRRSSEASYLDTSDWPVVLSEARRIIHYHGGAFDWPEEIGKDTGVLVTLPLAGRRTVHA